MRIIFACLPTLLLLTVVAALSTHASVTSADARDARVQANVVQLEQERNAIANRLEQLRARQHHVLPRGGLTD